MSADDITAAEALALQATDPAAWNTAVQVARDAGFPAETTGARLALLDDVSIRCVMSRDLARFWRAVTA